MLDPATVAVMVLDCPPVSEAEVGDTEMVTGVGTSDMAVLADLLESAALVAFTVTVCADEIVAGAV